MITLLTPTRNRSVAFGLAEEWFKRQTYTGEVQWIVVNDGTEPYEYTCGQDVITRRPDATSGHSLPANLLAGMLLVKGEKLVIYEDDDWIHPSYLSMHDLALDDYDLVGFSPSRHYNFRYNRWRVNRTQHCNLGSTGMTERLYPTFVNILKKKAEEQVFTIDISLWKYRGLVHRINNTHFHVGIKGLPGEMGLGVGHREIGTIDQAPLATLGTWIGKDVERYRALLDLQSGSL